MTERETSSRDISMSRHVRGAKQGIERSFKKRTSDPSSRAQLGLGGILGQAQQTLGQVQGKPEGSEGGRYAEIVAESFTGPQGTTWGDNLSPGDWIDLAQFTVRAQNQYNVGFGTADIPSKVGRWAMHLDDGSGNQVKGIARIKTRNANQEGVDTEVRSIHTRRLNKIGASHREQFAVPEQLETDRVGEDSNVVLQFKLANTSTGTTVDFSAQATKVTIPLTNYS